MHFSNAEFDRVETERLVLRRLTDDDLAEYHRIHGDPATFPYSPDGWHRELAPSEQQIRMSVEHWAEHGFGYWAVEREGRVIGFGGIWLMPDWRGLGDVLNLYYRFEPEAWGHGYASEMVAAALELGPSLPAIARIRPGNDPSARVAVRAGLARRADLDHDGFEVYARGLD